MQTQNGFTAMTAPEFEPWIAGVSVARQIDRVQHHHTWSPDYSNFDGSNHFTLQRAMKNHHVNNNGWSDIGQHFSIFPDGMVLTGRPLNQNPACIYGNNARSICIESIGNFDIGKDQMRPPQAQAIISITRSLLLRFAAIGRDDRGVVYHHWFDLNTGQRTNGSGVTKSCPGTAFFGGNSVAAFNTNFLPLITGVAAAAARAPLRLVAVTADGLNVRKGPAASYPVVQDHGPVQAGAILRVWRSRGNWLKVSNSRDHWVFGKLTEPVRQAMINTDDSKGRAGPGTQHPVVTSFAKGDKVYARAAEGGWLRVDPMIWVRETLITRD